MNEDLTRRCVDPVSLAAFETYKRLHAPEPIEEMPPLDPVITTPTEDYTDDEYELIRARVARRKMLNRMFDYRRGNS